jgi:hypothetical protein
MEASLAEDRAGLAAALAGAGFISPLTLQRHARALDNMIEILVAHLGRPGLFDFADRSFVEQLRSHAETIVADRAAWHIPPAETLFLQRKVSGMALLAVKLKARLPLRAMVGDALSEAPGDG